MLFLKLSQTLALKCKTDAFSSLLTTIFKRNRASISISVGIEISRLSLWYIPIPAAPNFRSHSVVSHTSNTHHRFLLPGKIYPHTHILYGTYIPTFPFLFTHICPDLRPSERRNGSRDEESSKQCPGFWKGIAFFFPLSRTSSLQLLRYYNSHTRKMLSCRYKLLLLLSVCAYLYVRTFQPHCAYCRSVVCQSEWGGIILAFSPPQNQSQEKRESPYLCLLPFFKKVGSF